MFFRSKMQAKSAFCHTFRVACCLFTYVSVTFESAKRNAQCFEEALQHLQQQTRIANPNYSKQIELARKAAVEIFQHEMRGNSSSAINNKVARSPGISVAIAVGDNVVWAEGSGRPFRSETRTLDRKRDVHLS